MMDSSSLWIVLVTGEESPFPDSVMSKLSGSGISGIIVLVVSVWSVISMLPGADTEEAMLLFGSSLQEMARSAISAISIRVIFLILILHSR